MNQTKTVLVTFSFLFLNQCLLADNLILENRINDLEKRVSILEQALEDKISTDRWQNKALWKKLKKGMSTSDIKRILGQPKRIEDQVFPTWYYHSTSKLHAYVFFDEGKAQGWKVPDQQN